MIAKIWLAFALSLVVAFSVTVSTAVSRSTSDSTEKREPQGKVTVIRTLPSNKHEEQVSTEPSTTVPLAVNKTDITEVVDRQRQPSSSEEHWPVYRGVEDQQLIGQPFKNYSTCSVVLNTPYILYHPNGPLIDSSDFVLRFNRVPDQRLSRYMGMKTDAFTTNVHVKKTPSDDPLFLVRLYNRGARTDDELLSVAREHRMFSVIPRSSRVSLNSVETVKSFDRFLKAETGKPLNRTKSPSSGFFYTVLLLRHCRTLRLFGLSVPEQFKKKSVNTYHPHVFDYDLNFVANATTKEVSDYVYSTNTHMSTRNLEDTHALTWEHSWIFSHSIEKEGHHVMRMKTDV